MHVDKGIDDCFSVSGRDGKVFVHFRQIVGWRVLRKVELTKRLSTVGFPPGELHKKIGKLLTVNPFPENLSFITRQLS